MLIIRTKSGSRDKRRRRASSAGDCVIAISFFWRSFSRILKNNGMLSIIFQLLWQYYWLFSMNVPASADVCANCLKTAVICIKSLNPYLFKQFCWYAFYLNRRRSFVGSACRGWIRFISICFILNCVSSRCIILKVSLLLNKFSAEISAQKDPSTWLSELACLSLIPHPYMQLIKRCIPYDGLMTSKCPKAL